MRYVRRDDQLIIAESRALPICGAVLMGLAVAMLVFSAVAIPKEVVFLPTLLPIGLVWLAFFVMGACFFARSFRHEVVISPEGVRENCPLFPPKHRFFSWAEIADWGYAYTYVSSFGLLQNRYSNRRVYFSKTPIAVQGKNRNKRITGKCISLYCDYGVFDEKLYRLVLPFCAQFTNVKPYRAPDLKL